MAAGLRWLGRSISAGFSRFHPALNLLGFRACSTSSAGEELYDLVIVGGGMVGAALACSIGCEPSLSHRRVLLMESAPSPPRQVEQEEPYSNRVNVLSLGAVELMKKMNVWKHIEGMRAQPFTQLHVWDACSDARIVFDRHNFTMSDTVPQEQESSEDIIASSYHGDAASPVSESIMGYIVENRVVMAALARLLESQGSVEVQRGVRVKEIVQPSTEDGGGRWVELHLDNGETITTRLLVGADGPKSRVRQLGGFQQVGWKYDQSAVVATLHIHEVANNSTLWERFLPTGPIAMLPLSTTLSSLVWSTSPSHAKALLEMSEERFVDAVNAAFWDPLPQDDFVAAVSNAIKDTVDILTTVSPPPRQLPPTVSGVDGGSRAAFPLAIGHSPHYVKPRIALAGDAAHTVHVLSGLGLSLGLGDVATLSHTLLQTNSRGEEWGSLSSLTEYETSRQQYNIPTMAAVDGLNRLFSTSWAPAVLLRSLSLHFTNACPPAKDFIMEHAQKAA